MDMTPGTKKNISGKLLNLNKVYDLVDGIYFIAWERQHIVCNINILKSRIASV